MGPAAGEVVGFDAHGGWGVVRSDEGIEHPFHCTAIADGSRTVDVGAKVRYLVVAGHLGRWEATDVRTLSR